MHKCDPHAALPWFEGRRLAIRGLRDRWLTDRATLDAVGGIALFPQDRNLMERVVGDTTGSAPVGDPEGQENERQRGGPQGAVWGVLGYLSNYAREARERGDELPDDRNWEKTIRDQFAPICAPKQYIGFQYRDDCPFGAPCFQEGDVIYPLHMAASGEQVIIEYLTRLTYPSRLNHSIILVDEPEIHLHPTWVRQLYRLLPTMGVDNQFILTTRSPELRTLAAQDGCLVDMGELGVNG